MVKVGEETGKLNQTFLYLADYLDRQYALTSKTKNALIYPAFVIATFFVVMTLDVHNGDSETFFDYFGFRSIRAIFYSSSD